MKFLLPLSLLLVLAGCYRQAQSPQPAPVNSSTVVAPSSPSPYSVLTVFPDPILDELPRKYSSHSEEVGKSQSWQDAWKRDNSKTQLDGQRTVQLLELACYADITCHRVENPLRVATYELVRENQDIPEVRAALEWIRSTYQSGLPLDVPDDENGDFQGWVVEAMRSRMTEYAIEILSDSGSFETK